MAKKIIEARMKQRIDTKANWATENPVLLEGELGIVSDDKNLYKVGDGVTAWNDLPFRGFDGTLVHETGESENAAMSQKGVTESLTELAKEIENELLGVDNKTNSNYSEIVKLGAKLSVFRGGAMYIYSEKTEDGLYKVGEISHMYYNDKLYHLPTAIGEKLEIDNMPFSLVIERVEKPYVKITGFGLNNLKIRPIYFGKPVTIPTELMPTDSELNEESEKLLPNSIITKEINAVHSEIETLQTEKESQSELIEDLYNTKIDKEADDYYPQLTVGIADNLAGHEDATPSEIGFRRSGGGAILDGNARIESIKGNSVVWNQVIDYTLDSRTTNGITFTKNGDNSYVVSGELTSTEAYAFISSQFNQIKDHKYLLINDSDGSVSMGGYNIGGMLLTETTKIVTCGMSGLQSIALRVTATGAINTTIHPAVIDLTKMFGAGNEPTTIEEFYARKPLGIDEYAYNEGEVIHNATDKIESVGVNQWDEEWELGNVNSNNGETTNATNAIKSKNFIPVIGGKTYYFGLGSTISYINVVEYDHNKNFIKATIDGGDANIQKKLSLEVAYIKFGVAGYGSTYNHDICINLSDPSINGKYFPYVKREQNLDIIGKYFPNGMKSAGTAHDEIRYNKTTQKWEAVKRIGEVDLGTLDWYYVENASVGKLFTGDSISAVNIANRVLHICAKYTPMKASTVYQDLDIDKIITIEDGFQVRVRDSAYTDAATFKAAMAGVMLYYELAEPIVTEIEETFNLDYPVWNVGTEKAVADTPSTPLKADIIYGFNAYGVIKELLARVASLEAANASLASQLASVTSHNEEV